MTPFEWVAVIAAGTTAGVGFFALFEKVTGAMARWFQRQLSGSELAGQVAEIKRVTVHHLGHNGDSPRLTDRVAALEVVHGLEPKSTPPDGEGH